MGRSSGEDGYGELFSNLNTNRNRKFWTDTTAHRAPHKPLLLLTVMDMIEAGEITSNLVEPSDDLVELFGTYWSGVLPFHAPGNIALPFFHMGSEGFWHLVPAFGDGVAPSSGISSVGKLREIFAGARLDEDLFALLSHPASRERLRSRIIRTYFSGESAVRVAEQSRINRGAFAYSRELLDGRGRSGEQEVRESLPVADGYDTGGEKLRVVAAVRDQGFRRAVVKAYSHRCALCGIRVRTPDGHTTVTGAHIVPWRETRDDRAVNGLGLCRTCHWTFDEGLLGVSGSYEVVASSRLNSGDNLPGYLTSLEGRRIFLPTSDLYHPDTDSLAWHGKNVLRR